MKMMLPVWFLCNNWLYDFIPRSQISCLWLLIKSKIAKIKRWKKEKEKKKQTNKGKSKKEKENEKLKGRQNNSCYRCHRNCKNHLEFESHL